MPADRTRNAQSSDVRVDEMKTNDIAFAPNVTPGTFNDPPPSECPQRESILFPPSTEPPAPRRSGHSRKRPENHIPRPPNAFILFRSSFIKSQHVSTEVETNHSTLSKIIGLTWQNLPNDERQIWHAKAKAALEEHKRQYPQYAFRPLHKGKAANANKRKVREVGPKDLQRCAKIAELLVKGKKGTDLDAAIQEFDKHHVPQVVTRFETPMTAQMYRGEDSPSSLSQDGDEYHNPRITITSDESRSSSPQTAMTGPSRSASLSPGFGYPSTSMEAFRSKSQDPYGASLSIDEHPYFSTPSPPFDLTTLTYDHQTPHATSTFPCNPQLESLFPNTQSVRPITLSIDTSFTDYQAWTRSSSPLSTSTSAGSVPVTPSYTTSPLSDQYGSYIVDSFQHHIQLHHAPHQQHQQPFSPPQPSFNDVSQHINVEPSNSFASCDPYSRGDYEPFNFGEQSHVTLAASQPNHPQNHSELDVDFTAYMTQYVSS